MGGKRVELEGEARKARDRALAKEYQRRRRGVQLRCKPIGRTGEEEVVGWRKQCASNCFSVVFKDYYYRFLSYQTKVVWTPDREGGVLSIQIVLQNWEKTDVLGALKDTFTFGRHILVSEELKGTNRTLWQSYFRQPERPPVDKVKELYGQFCHNLDTPSAP